MRVKTFALPLLVLTVLAPFGGAQVLWTVYPDPVPREQPLRLKIENRLRSTIQLLSSAPWQIYDANNQPVFNPVGLPVVLSVKPLGFRQWTWNQKDNNQKPVPAGTYEARIVYSLQTRKYTLKTKFQVEPTTFAVAGQATPGGQVKLDLHAPTSTGTPYRMACSLGAAPGLPLPGNRLLALNPDPLFFLSILFPDPVFKNFAGITSKSGYATGFVNIPGAKVLIGVTFHAAAATLRPAAPGGIHVHSASKAIRIQ